LFWHRNSFGSRIYPGIAHRHCSIHERKKLTNKLSRKFSISPNLDPQQYLAWRQTHPSSDESQQQQAQPTSTTTTTQAAAAPSSESHTIATEAESSTSAAPSSSTTSEPAYPASFAHIVELITTGQPIPGIEEIPDTVLAGQETPSIAPQRRKPWENEKVEEQERGDDTIDDSLVNGVAQGEQGAGAGRSE
jgi:guanyl-specific ribonuclease Sa